MELTLDQALQKGVEAHKAGKAQKADQYYTAILKANPKHPDANHNMGVLAVSVGKVEEALPFFKTALGVNPNIAQYWLSYIDALIFKISFGLKNYYYFMSSSFLFFWLYILLFYEIKTSNKNKLFISLFFILLISNRTWLQFLFTSSLMSERIAGYLFSGILVTLFSVRNPSSIEISYIYFILSFVYLTKQFFSVIILISFFWFYLNKHSRKATVFLVSAGVLNGIA